MQTGVSETLDKTAFFATINQVATLSLWTYGMAVLLIMNWWGFSGE